MSYIFRLCLAFTTFALLATPALALDLNSSRAQHGRPALSASAFNTA